MPLGPALSQGLTELGRPRTFQLAGHKACLDVDPTALVLAPPSAAADAAHTVSVRLGLDVEPPADEPGRLSKWRQSLAASVTDGAAGSARRGVWGPSGGGSAGDGPDAAFAATACRQAARQLGAVTAGARGRGRGCQRAGAASARCRGDLIPARCFCGGRRSFRRRVGGRFSTHPFASGRRVELAAARPEGVAV